MSKVSAWRFAAKLERKPGVEVHVDEAEAVSGHGRFRLVVHGLDAEETLKVCPGLRRFHPTVFSKGVVWE